MHHQVMAVAAKVEAVVSAIRAERGHLGPSALRAKAATLAHASKRLDEIAAQKEKEAGPSGFTLPNIFGR